MSETVIIAILIAAAIYIFSKPIRFVMKLVFSTLLGFAALFVLNFIGAEIGIVLELNWQSALITGILGVPGLALLVVLTWYGII